MNVTTKLTLYKTLAGKVYPIKIEILDNGEAKIDVSKHPGSTEQLKKLIQSVADELDTTWTEERHINKHGAHQHVHDKNLENE